MMSMEETKRRVAAKRRIRRALIRLGLGECITPINDAPTETLEQAAERIWAIVHKIEKGGK